MKKKIEEYDGPAAGWGAVKAVAEALDGLPPVKMHCSVLAEEAIHKAINDYRKSKGMELWDFEEHGDDLHDHVHGEE